MPRHRTRGVTAVALAIAALIGVNVPAVAEVTPVTVLATSDWEVGPAATADHLAWTVQGNVARAYAQRGIGHGRVSLRRVVRRMEGNGDAIEF